MLCFCSIAMYLDDFCFLLLVLSKVDCKILVSFKQIQNFEVSNLAMAKVKKVFAVLLNDRLCKCDLIYSIKVFFARAGEQTQDL